MPGVSKEDNFQSLVQTLSERLGPCSGIDSEDVDERELQQLMKDYTSNESEWAKYFFPSSKMAYTRNLVDKGNGKSNLVCRTYEGCYRRLLTTEADSCLVAWQGEPYPRVSFFAHRLLTFKAAQLMLSFPIW
jgi:hypothetical protein